MSRNKRTVKKKKSKNKGTSRSRKSGKRKILVEWRKPSHIFVKRSMADTYKLLFFLFLLLLYLALVRQWALMLGVISLGFLIYVLRTTKPEEVKHQINSKGVETLENFYPWSKLRDFWFVKKTVAKKDFYLLYVDTHLTYPGRLIMLVNKGDIKKVYNAMIKNLDYLDREKPQSRLDRLMDGEYLGMKE